MLLRRYVLRRLSALNDRSALGTEAGIVSMRRTSMTFSEKTRKIVAVVAGAVPPLQKLRGGWPTPLPPTGSGVPAYLLSRIRKFADT